MILEFYNFQKHVILCIFDCPSFNQLERESQGNPCTFFYPQKGLNIPTTKKTRCSSSKCHGNMAWMS